MWFAVLCGVLPSVRLVFPSCAVGGRRMVAFGSVVSMPVEGVVLDLRIFCGARSCSFDLVCGVSTVACDLSFVVLV